MICQKCHTDKDLTEFRSTYTRKDGSKYYRPTCEKCDGKARCSRNVFRNPDRSAYFKARNALERKSRRDGFERDRWILVDSKHDDRRHGRANNLDREFIQQQIANGCSYCGETEILIGLDRVDNALGHTKDNVRSACIRCNCLRRDMPFEAWLVLVPSVREARERGLFLNWKVNPSRTGADC